MASEDSGLSRRVNQSFLLIARTRRVVTALNCRASTAGFSGFPAYSQILFSELQTVKPSYSYGRH